MPENKRFAGILTTKDLTAEVTLLLDQFCNCKD